jgi:hypothetical protein
MWFVGFPSQRCWGPLGAGIVMGGGSFRSLAERISARDRAAAVLAGKNVSASLVEPRSLERFVDVAPLAPDCLRPLPGDRWCLCAPRWQDALAEGQAPRVVLRATHEGALDTALSPITSGSR